MVNYDLLIPIYNLIIKTWDLETDRYEGQWRKGPSVRVPGNQWANLMSILPKTGNVLLPQGVKAATRSCGLSNTHSRILLQMCELPHPLMPLLRCWALSFVLKRSKSRPCRCVGCSPTQALCRCSPLLTHVYSPMALALFYLPVCPSIWPPNYRLLGKISWPSLISMHHFM